MTLALTSSRRGVDRTGASLKGGKDDGTSRPNHGSQPGIGAATALILAEHGYRVVVNDRASAPQAEEVVATIVAAGGEAIAIKADVTVPDDVTAIGEIDQRWGGTDVLGAATR